MRRCINTHIHISVVVSAKESTESRTQYWKGKTELPVFEWTKSKKVSTRRDQKKLEDILSILMYSCPQEKICKSKPVAVDRNCSFVVSTKSLENIDDLFADDCAAWDCTGSPRFYFEEKEEEGTVSFNRIGRGSEVNVEKLRKPWHEVVLHYYKNKSSPDFKRTVTMVKGN